MTRISEPSSSEFGRAPNSDRRQVKNGEPTNNLVLSAYSDGNDRTFPRILSLYVAPGSIVADVTFGKGVFWRRVPPGEYEILATDIQVPLLPWDLPKRNRL